MRTRFENVDGSMRSRSYDGLRLTAYCSTTHTCALFLTSPGAVNMRGFPAPLIICRCAYLAVIMPQHFDTCILLMTHPRYVTITAAGSVEIKIHALLCMPFPLNSDSSCVRVSN